MVVRADLNRPVAGIGHREGYGLASGVESDVAGLDEELARSHAQFLSFVIARRAQHGEAISGALIVAEIASLRSQ
jgi:hypothetical protein